MQIDHKKIKLKKNVKTLKKTKLIKTLKKQE